MQTDTLLACRKACCLWACEQGYGCCQEGRELRQLLRKDHEAHCRCWLRPAEVECDYLLIFRAARICSLLFGLPKYVWRCGNFQLTWSKVVAHCNKLCQSAFILSQLPTSCTCSGLSIQILSCFQILSEKKVMTSYSTSMPIFWEAAKLKQEIGNGVKFFFINMFVKQSLKRPEFKDPWKSRGGKTLQHCSTAMMTQRWVIKHWMSVNPLLRLSPTFTARILAFCCSTYSEALARRVLRPLKRSGR